MATGRNALLARPQWVISNQLTLPLVTIADNGKKSVRGLVGIAVPITIFLDTLFNDKVVVPGGRSITQDQFQVYKSVEGALQTAGINGKACLLRAICEMQTRELGHYSLAGELLLFLLRPRSEGTVYDAFLDDYRLAEKLGQSENATTCSTSYRECPVSVFELFQQQYSTADDKPASWENENDAGDDNGATSQERLNDPLHDDHLLREKHDATREQHTLVDGMNHLS